MRLKLKHEFKKHIRQNHVLNQQEIYSRHSLHEKMATLIINIKTLRNNLKFIVLGRRFQENRKPSVHTERT